MCRLLLISGVAMAFLLSLSCSMEENHAAASGNIDVELPPAAGDDSLIDMRLFEVVDLDYPGLEKVKSSYEAGKYYAAAAYLLEYYRSRTSVANPLVDLVSASASESDINIADQATREGGYRFYVRNYEEGTDQVTGLPIYWSFADGDGGIDWDFVPEGLTERQFMIQKHRHQWMEPQARAYRVTKNEKYVLAWKDVYGSWLDRYPCPQPVGSLAGHSLQDMWTDLQATSRTTSQINIFQYYIHSVNFTPEWLSVFLVVFSDCVECIRANYYHTENSNHRLYEVQAVLYAGLMMPEFAAADAWVEEAAGDAARQLRIQFLQDGMQVELDPSYHIGVLGIFREMYLVAEANGRQDLFPPDYMETLRLPAHFVKDIMYPDYSIDNFNDTRSDSWTRRVLMRNFGYYSEMFPGDGELEWLASAGESGSEPEDLMTVYPVSGWCMLRDGWTEDSMMLVLKNNDNSGGWWHCQPDNGTIGLYRNGRRFLPDAGSFSYGGGPSDDAARESYRATSSHNTVTRDGETIDDSNCRGRIRLAVTGASGDDPGSGELLFGNGQVICSGAVVCDAVISENDSYSDMSHRRSVFFVDRKFYVVSDEVYGSGGGFPAVISFHFCDPVSSLAYDSSYGSGVFGAHTLFDDGNNMIFKTFCDTDDGFEVETGVSSYSDAISDEVDRPFYRLSVTKPAGETMRFATVILPCGSAASFREDRISLKFTDDSSSLEVTVDGKAYVLGFTGHM